MLFVEKYGSIILEKNLCRNVLLHLVSMHDFGLVSTMTIDKAMALLRQGQLETEEDDNDDGDASDAPGQASKTAAPVKAQA